MRTTPWPSTEELARSLAENAARESRPVDPRLHLLGGGSVPQLLVVNGTRLYDLSAQTAIGVRAAMEADDPAVLDRVLIELGLDAPPAIDDRPLEDPPVHALSLAVAQKCNLGCTYCYAQQGTFGGTAKAMSADTARRSVDLLVGGHAPGSRVTLSVSGRRAAHESPGGQGRDLLRGRTRQASRGRGPLLDYHEWHATHRGGCQVFRGARLRCDHQPRWDQGRARPPSALSRRVGQLRPNPGKGQAVARSPASDASLGSRHGHTEKYEFAPHT